MPRFRAVLFDFDGTLADSYAAITASVNHVLAFHGRPPLSEAQVRGLVGHGLVNLMETILPGLDPEANARRYREHHPTVMKELTKLLPGIPEGLMALKAVGIELGVCSNKPSNFTNRLLQILDLAPYFETVYGPEEAGAAKPDPAMIVQSLARMNVPLKEALYVGDMDVDIETGRRAGVETWVMPTGSNDEATLRAARPDRVLAGIPDVVAAVLRE